jgi:hypothetical protein
VGSRRIAGNVFITVAGYQLCGNNSKPDLGELAAHTLAEFGLTCDRLMGVSHPKVSDGSVLQQD